MRTLLVTAALAVGLLASAPTTARACYYGGCASGALAAAVIAAAIGGTAVGLATVGVLGMDLTYAMRDRPQPTDFAVANLVLGAVDVIGGTALAFGGNATYLGFGLGFAASGVILLIDAAIALAMGPGESRGPPLGLALEASPEGVVVGLDGRF